MLSSEGFKRRKNPLRDCVLVHNFNVNEIPDKYSLTCDFVMLMMMILGVYFFFCMRFNFVSVSRVGLRMARIHLHKHVVVHRWLIDGRTTMVIWMLFLFVLAYCAPFSRSNKMRTQWSNGASGYECAISENTWSDAHLIAAPNIDNKLSLLQEAPVDGDRTSRRRFVCVCVFYIVGFGLLCWRRFHRDSELRYGTYLGLGKNSRVAQ